MLKKLVYCDQPHENWVEQIYTDYYSKSPHNSKHLFEIYSLTHIFWKIVLTVIIKQFCSNNKLNMIFIPLISVLFEIHENLDVNIKKYQRIEIDSQGFTSYRGDSIINIIGDIMCGILGVYIGLYFDVKIVIFILISLFIIITKILGLVYWNDFFKFLIK